MITVMKLGGVNVGETALGKFTPSAAGAALAQIPEWKMFYDSEFYQNAAQSILNRVNGNDTNFSGGSFNLVEGPPKLMRKAIASGGSVVHVGEHDINPEEWSFFIVLKPTYSATSADGFRFLRKTDDTGSQSSIYLALSASTRIMSIYRYASGGTPRVQFTLPEGGALSDLAHPTILVFSFSTRTGCAIRMNGKEVVRSTSAAGKETVESGLSAGSWDLFRNANGDYYNWGGFNIDITLPENSNYLDSLEQYFMNKYSIPVMP